MFENIASIVRWCPPEVLKSVLDLAVEIAREGREGRRIGTLFTIGNADAVLAHSRPLILDPLAGHAPERTRIQDRNLRGTLKELAQLDGGFVITETGIVVAAARYFEATASRADLPLGLGSRHVAALSMSQIPNVVAIVVSESAVVRVFHQGKLIAEILPELWLLRARRTELHGRVKEEQGGVMVVTSARRTRSGKKKRKKRTTKRRR